MGQLISLPAPREERRLLLVDDNVECAEALAELLSLKGWAVSPARDAFVALDLAAGSAFDVCILDIGLPKMNGCELARRLRALHNTASATLIALTGFSDHDSRLRAVDAGFNHFLVKPLDLEGLQRILLESRSLTDFEAVIQTHAAS